MKEYRVIYYVERMNHAITVNAPNILGAVMEAEHKLYANQFNNILTVQLITGVEDLNKKRQH